MFRTLSLLFIVTLSNMNTANAMDNNHTATAVFAGGCFWCMEAEFEALDGVEEAVSGYTGGDAASANYDDVSRGRTRHREAVQVIYHPEKVTYATLLDIYIHNVDPFDADGQFCDKGFHYTPAIYTATDDERAAAQALLTKVEDVKGKKPAVALEDAGEFFPAEDYHQNFHRTNALRYNAYKNGCGRKERLSDIGGFK